MERDRARPTRLVVIDEDHSWRTVVLNDDGDYPAFFYSGPEQDPAVWNGTADDAEWSEPIIPGEPLLRVPRRAA